MNKLEQHTAHISGALRRFITGEVRTSSTLLTVDLQCSNLQIHRIDLPVEVSFADNMLTFRYCCGIPSFRSAYI